MLEFHSVNPIATPQYTLPVVDDGQEYFYQGGDYGDVVFPVQPEDREVVSEFLGTASTDGPTGRALPSAASFTVAVENGSGLYDQGSTTAAALRQLGYNVTSVTDTTAGASTTEATVLYSKSSELADALRVQSALSGLAIVGYDPGLVSDGAPDAGGGGLNTSNTIDVGSTLSTSDGADVVVVTGSNFAVNAPTSPPPSTTAPGSSTTTSSVASTPTTTTPGPLADNPNLAAPSGATQSTRAVGSALVHCQRGRGSLS